MMHDLEQRAVAVREQHLVGGDADDPSAEVQGLFVRLHAAIVTGSAADVGGGYSRRFALMTTTAHLEKLNAAQRKAVTHGEALPEKGYRAGPLLIVAGAGTGKTDTLAHRVAHLVLNGVDPARILMLTFTRRAALEMRRRAQDITRRALDQPLGGAGQSIAQRLSWAGTFHSIGNRLLRHYAVHLQLDPHF